MTQINPADENTTPKDTAAQGSDLDVNRANTAGPVAPAATAKPALAGTGFGVYFLSFWALLLSFAFALGGFWLYQDNRQQAQNVTNLQMQLGSQQQLLADSQEKLQAALEDELVGQQASVQKTIDAIADEVRKNTERVASLSSSNNENWKLAEAQYLLRLANQRILLEQDSQNALALALSADDILRDLNLTDLINVRTLLAEEITVLKQTGSADREGIFMRLSALANQIDGIPFVEPLGPQVEDEEQEVPADETFKQSLARHFNNFLVRLSSYVRVRDHSQNVTALLPPSEQMYLQQNLHLIFEQAQVALLRNEVEIYQQSLIKAQNWINQYYTLNTKATLVLDELQALQAEEVAPELTNFSNSASALNDYINRRREQNNSALGGQ